MRHLRTTDDILSKPNDATRFLAASFRCWDHPNDLLSVPAATAVSHSLLLAPAGDPRKPGQEPTHLTRGFPREHQDRLRRLLPG
jgi:hypothetical protein